MEYGNSSLIHTDPTHKVTLQKRKLFRVTLTLTLTTINIVMPQISKRSRSFRDNKFYKWGLRCTFATVAFQQSFSEEKHTIVQFHIQTRTDLNPGYLQYSTLLFFDSNNFSLKSYDDMINYIELEKTESCKNYTKICNNYKKPQ